MKRTIAIFAVGLAWAIAMSSACAAAENNAEHQSSAGSPIVVAQAMPKPTDADKKKLSEEIQKRYKPGPGSKSALPNSKMSADSGTASSCTQSTAQIAACSAACSASCIFQCFPPNTPWGSGCHSCVNTCMDKCTGCGTGTSQ